MGPLLPPTSPTATPPPATTVPTLSEMGTSPRGRLRLKLRLRPIPTTDTDTPDLATLAWGATEDTVLATAVDTPALDTPDLATTVATLDTATDTAVATDTSDKKDPIYKGFQDQRKAEPLQLNARTGSVSALRFLTAGYFWH